MCGRERVRQSERESLKSQVVYSKQPKLGLTQEYKREREGLRERDRECVRERVCVGERERE